MSAIEPMLVAFYPGAYGPTLRIQLRNGSQLAAMRRSFTDLARGRVDDAPFDALVPVAYDGLERLVVRSNGAFGDSKSVTRLDADGLPTFEWTQTPRRWDDCVALLDGLTGGPGHQYLSNEGIDDALIEVSYREV